MIRLILLLCTVLWAGVTYAETATIAWNANPEADLAGYRLYQHDAANQWKAPVLLAKTSTSYTTPTLIPGTWFFLLTAIDVAGNESLPSQKVSKVIGATPPPPPPPPVAPCMIVASQTSEEIIIRLQPCTP
jgi:hypothetical protein